MSIHKNSHFQLVYKQALQEVAKSNAIQKPQLYIQLKNNTQIPNYQPDISQAKIEKVKTRQRSLHNISKFRSTPKIITEVQLSSGRFKILHTKKNIHAQKLPLPQSSPLNQHSYNTLPVISQLSNPKSKQIKSRLVKNIQNYVTHYKSKSVYSAQTFTHLKHKTGANIIFKNLQSLKGWQDMYQKQDPIYFDTYHFKL